MHQDLIKLSTQIGEILTRKHLTVAAAESCTGGLLSHTLTGVSGSSRYFIGGIVAYSDKIKTDLLGVQPTTLEQYGAVSSQTAEQMAEGIRKLFQTDIGLSTTGIAGPTGGTDEKPVGLVWTGVSTGLSTQTFKFLFKGDRAHVKACTVHQILMKLLIDFKELENEEEKIGQ